MTEFEFAKLIETTNLTNGVVVYDKERVIVVTKSILTHPDCISEYQFLFIIDKKTKVRIGGIMNLGDDIQVYIKPVHRGKGYTSHVMREIVPYWMPKLISVTSFFEYQDAKIEYLASCAHLKLRPKHLTSQEQYALWRAMDKKGEEVLESSAYARALDTAEQNPKGLRECPDKVSYPRRLRKNYGITDTEFAEDLERCARIDCQTGDIILPKNQFTSIDFKASSAEEIYLALHRLCEVKINDDFDTPIIEIKPYDDVPMNCYSKVLFTERLSLDCVRLESDKVCVSIYSPCGYAPEWVQKYTRLDNANLKSLEENSEIFFSWGSIYVDDECLDFEFNRTFEDNTIAHLIQKYQIT